MAAPHLALPIPHHVGALFSSFLAEGLEGRNITDRGGRGVFATRPFETGEFVARFGGLLVRREAVLSSTPEQRSRTLQVGEDLFLFSTDEDVADWINHACDPCCGFEDEFTLVARRPIAVDEEITFDYAMSDSISYDEFNCGCGSELCRGVVEASDWLLPALQRRYAGFFSPYLRAKARLSLSSVVGC